MITLLIPIYNKRDRIVECVMSIAAQSERNFKIIISDNGSDDGSGQLATRLLTELGMEHRYVQQASNIGSARNFLGLLDLLETEYFSFVDCEDELSVNYIEQMLAIATAQRPSVIIPSFIEYGQNRRGREMTAWSDIDRIPYESRLPFVATLTNHAGVAYIWYATYNYADCQDSWRRILNSEIAQPTPYGAGDISIGYTMAAKCRNIAVARQASVKHWGRFVVDDARMAVNLRAIEEIYYFSSPPLMRSAVDIMELAQVVDAQTIQLLRQIMDHKFALLAFQHALLQHIAQPAAA